jgi:hypothetical protein
MRNQLALEQGAAMAMQPAPFATYTSRMNAAMPASLRAPILRCASQLAQRVKTSSQGRAPKPAFFAAQRFHRHPRTGNAEQAIKQATSPGKLPKIIQQAHCDAIPGALAEPVIF